MALAVFLTLWSMLAVSRGTSTAEFLGHLMVVLPAALISRITPLYGLAMVIGLCLGSMIIWYGQRDIMRTTASALPEVVTWLTTFEVSIWLDAMIMLARVASLARLRLLSSLARAASMHFMARLGMSMRQRSPRSD
ncbi:hypothetical protein P792_10870 [Asaia sp. SF2.1]|nr:hypothetical protein P792_10870 [Asaia sp. SF2.1]